MSPITPVSVGLVADDLTGAADSVAPFARSGWHVEIGRASCRERVSIAV